MICYTKISQELKMINLVYCHALAVYNLYCLLYVQIVHQMNLSLQCDRSYMIISSFSVIYILETDIPLEHKKKGPLVL